MAEDENLNPEEKPSFFDSADEAASWPPAGSYEVDEDADNETGEDESTPESGLQAIDFFKDAKPKIDENEDLSLFQEVAEEPQQEEAQFIINEEIIEEPSPVSPEPIAQEETFQEPDALDEILGLEYSEQETIFNETKPEELPESIPEKEAEAEPEILSEQVQDPIQQEKEEDPEDEVVEMLFPEPSPVKQEFVEPVVEEFKPEIQENQEFDDSLHEELEAFSEKTEAKNNEDLLTSPLPFIDAASPANFDTEPAQIEAVEETVEPELDLVPIEASSNEEQVMTETVIEASTEEEDTPEPIPEPVQEEIFTEPEQAEEIQTEDPFKEDVDELLGISDSELEEDDDTLPFRTFSAYDYSEETILEDNEEEEEKTGVAAFLANRNLVILTAVLLLFGGYFTYNTFFVDKREYVSKRQSRRPKKSNRNILTGKKELVPVWEVAAQKSKGWGAESRLVKDIYKGSGRKNPFSMPESIIADLRRAAELDRLRNQKPNTYRRTAYRATLVGVLTSKDNTIGLINQQSADFDILEGTGKRKILKLATKAMNKSKKNTQEMVVGSYIGPWQITGISSPQNAFTEAKVTIEYEGLEKVLVMGKAVELGIFNEEGDIDNLEEPRDEISYGDDY